jgi:hypothetical protein
MRLGLALNHMIRKRDRDRSASCPRDPSALVQSFLSPVLPPPEIPLECETLHLVANEIGAGPRPYKWGGGGGRLRSRNK